MSARRAGTGGRPVGLPKTGGRQKGTPNKSTSFLRERLAAQGCDPADELLKIAREPNTRTESRIQVYSILLPYVYPRPKPLDPWDSSEQAQTTPSRLNEVIAVAKDFLARYGEGTKPAETGESDQSVKTEDKNATNGVLGFAVNLQPAGD